MSKSVNPFYLTKKWIKKRGRILRRDKYQCQECKRYGKTTPANTVHHCFPFEAYPEYKFNSFNLISVCGKCHGTFHNRVTDELTDKGKYWMEKVRSKVEKMSE